MLAQPRLRAGILWVVSAASLIGCETLDFRRGGSGESCGRTDDCEAPLVCVSLVCVSPDGTTTHTTTSLGGSTSSGGTAGSGGRTGGTGGTGGSTSTGGTTSSGGTGGGGTTSSGGTGGAGGEQILDPVLCHECLNDQCGTPIAACGTDCLELEACIETLCSHLSEIVSPEEGQCQVHCQQLHIGSKSKHLAVVNCALGAHCPPCSSYPWDYDHCQESATLPPGVCADLYQACNDDPDCVTYRSCVATCSTLTECLECQNVASGTSGGVKLEDYEYCVSSQCLAESWIL